VHEQGILKADASTSGAAPSLLYTSAVLLVPAEPDQDHGPWRPMATVLISSLPLVEGNEPVCRKAPGLVPSKYIA
jgi:hypothetical protein